LNIDKSRIGCYGGSAGGGASIWLGFKDDMADLTSSDPVLRESTRIKSIGHLNSQASYDPLVMEDIFDEFGIDFFSLTDVTEAVLEDYNIVSLNELTTNEQVINMRKDLDMLGWMTSDDPEFYTSNTNSTDNPINKGEAIHHPLQARALYNKAMQLGVVGNAFIPEVPSIPQTNESLPQFICRKLN
jgi:para-nitrobenzyl esterase